MDELPNDLRALIDLARDGHDPPDDQAQQRVRLALVAAVGAPAAGTVLGGGKAAAVGGHAQASLAAGKTGILAFSTKLTALAVGAVAAAGIGLAVYEYQASPRQTQAVVSPAHEGRAAEPEEPADSLAPRVEPLAPQVTELRRAAPPTLDVTDRPSAKTHRTAPAPDTLSEEVALLRAASEALARGDEAGALVPLRTHAKRYPHGSLREERDGLRAIAVCTQAPDPHAARRFQRLYPASLLSARVVAACRAP